MPLALHSTLKNMIVAPPGTGSIHDTCIAGLQPVSATAITLLGGLGPTGTGDGFSSGVTASTFIVVFNPEPRVLATVEDPEERVAVNACASATVVVETEPVGMAEPSTTLVIVHKPASSQCI